MANENPRNTGSRGDCRFVYWGYEMNNLRSAIADNIKPFVIGNSAAMNSKHAFEAADVAIETVIARIPPLVWGQSYWLDGNHVTPAGFYEVRNESSGCYVYFAQEKILGFNACWDEEAAKAAANAHHVAQLCKGMGIE